MSSIDPAMAELPAALPAMWRALRRGYVAEPWLLSIAFILSLLAAIPDAIFALWLALLALGFTENNTTWLWIGGIGLGCTATLTWTLRVVSDRTQRRFRDRVSIALESHVANLQASVVTVEHHERPEILDRLAILREQVFVLDHMYMSIFSTAGWFLRLVVTGLILIAVHPLMLLLVVFALPTVGTAVWRPGLERQVEQDVAQHDRLAMHLFALGTTASPAKEVRLTGIANQIGHRRRDEWNKWYRPVAKTRIGTAVYSSISWLIFGAGFVAAVSFAVYGIETGVAGTLLILAAGSRLSSYISATVGELGFLRGIWMDGSKRLAWLEDYAESVEQQSNEIAPSSLEDGIELIDVSFAYPGSPQLALDNVNIKLKAGSVVALVGENGAGKTTLVKLLARMYLPTQGRICVDGQDVARIKASSWRTKLSGAFQDFYRFELPVHQTVGLGDTPRIEDRRAVSTAVKRAGAESVVDELPRGIDTQLGHNWPDGVEVSFGQWQKLSLARGFMPDNPLLLILDEPTAALDAETEHNLFERYASTAQDAHAIENGRITLLVSHRFSTVRMADQIVVLDGARVVETGSHEELIRLNGQYAELYSIQASAYQA